MSKIELRWANWLSRGSRSPVNRSHWPLSTLATAESQRQPQQLNRACNWKWLNFPKPNAASCCCLAGGWWRTPNHNTPETLCLTEPTPRPMLGISGLLQLLTWVEHRRTVQASQCEEGGVPCSIPHPTRLPPAPFQASYQSVGGSAPGQSSAAPLAAESPARTPVGTEQCTGQGGRR
jgi:hypothetical protein